MGSLSAVIKAPLLCLTGTTTSQIKVDVEKILEINDVHLVTILPDRPEIHINVIKPATNDKYKELVEWLSEMIATAHTRCRKILLFFPTIKEASSMYSLMEDALDEKMYVNGTYDVQDRIVEMYHARMDQQVKDRVSLNFSKLDSMIRVLCATIAYGLGVSVSDISTVILWGVPKTCLSLWQQIGRAARDGRQGEAIVYLTGHTLGKCEPSVIEVLKAPCIRKAILARFVLLDNQIDKLPSAK